MNNYPYYNLVYKLDKKNIKKIVKEFKPKIITTKFLDAQKYNKKYFIILDKWEDNNELNSLTDYFTEEIRIQCKFGKHLSPLEYWQKNKMKYKEHEIIFGCS